MGTVLHSVQYNKYKVTKKSLTFRNTNFAIKLTSISCYSLKDENILHLKHFLPISRMGNNVEEGSKLKIGHWNSEIDRRCEECDMNFFDIQEFYNHMAWHKHGKHYCEACNVYSNCQKDYDFHLNGRKHKKNQVRIKKYKDKNEHKEEMKNLRKANPNLSKYYCKVCYVYANCQKTYDWHLNGRKHKKHQKKIIEIRNQFKLQVKELSDFRP